jgi:MFS family permease
LAFIDRVNIGYAQLQMKVDLGFSASVYGLGAGVFFIGYLIFELPSNLVLSRIGARATFARIMVGWGLVSAATMFVSTPAEFYIARFMLGAFEAGFVPGVIFYLSIWLPADRQARSLALFLTASVIAGIVGGPLTGWVMTAFDGAYGLRGWHWVFLVEGLPSAIYGVCLYFALPNRPSDAKWLTVAERNHVTRAVLENTTGSGNSKHESSFDFLKGPTFYALCLTSFLSLCGVYAVLFWTPQMIAATGVSNPFHIGLYAMIPNAITLVSMIVVSRHSDRVLERRWHYAVTTLVGGAGLGLCTMIPSNLPAVLAGLSIAEAGAVTAVAIFWAQATLVLPRFSAAASLALINSCGNLGGFAAPSIIGLIQASTGSLSHGLQAAGGATVVAGLIMLAGTRPYLSYRVK